MWWGWKTVSGLKDWMRFRWKKVIVRTGIKSGIGKIRDGDWRMEFFFFFKNGIIEADIKEGVWLLQITG